MTKNDWNLLVDIVAEHIHNLEIEKEELEDDETIAEYDCLLEDACQLQNDLARHIEIVKQVTYWKKFMTPLDKDSYLLRISTPGITKPSVTNPYLAEIPETS